MTENGAKFSDYNAAARMKEATRDIAKKVVFENYQRPRLATVMGFDFWNSLVDLQYPGETVTFTVPFPGSILPTEAGHTVRVAGTHGDRYIDECFGPVQFKTADANYVAQLAPGGLFGYPVGSFFPSARWSHDPTVSCITPGLLEVRGEMQAQNLRMTDNFTYTDLDFTHGDEFWIGASDGFQIDLGLTAGTKFRLTKFGTNRFTVDLEGDMVNTGAGDFGTGLLDNFPMDLHGFGGATIRWYDGTNLNASYYVGASGDATFDTQTGGYFAHLVNAVEVSRIISTEMMFGKTATNAATAGVELFKSGRGYFTTDTATNVNIVANIINGANGDVFASFRRNNTQIGAITQATTTTTAYGTSSDEVLKNILGEMSNEDALMMIRDLHLVWYTEKDDPSGSLLFGLVAQDVLPFAPWAVTPRKGNPGDDDFEAHTLDYGRTSALYLGGLKALDSEIERIKQHIGLS